MRWWLAALLACSGCANRYLVQGLVLEVGTQSFVVSHKEIPGVMPAMSMPLRVKRPAELTGVKPGSLVEFRLSGSQAEHVRLIAAGNTLDQDGRRVLLEKPKETLALGAMVPDFALVTEAGQRFSLAGQRGSVVAVQFLYTRCPLPEVCPRLAATFSRIARRFASRDDLVLLTITLDPRHDTPEVLARYARLYRGAFRRWHFLTGTDEQVRKVVALFGISYFPDEGVITHTSTLAVIGRDGRLAAAVEGLSFDARQLGDLVQSVIEAH